MREYRCYYYSLNNGKFVINSNDACWLGLKNFINNKVNEIFIDIKDPTHNSDFRDLVVETINEITPCSVLKDLKGELENKTIIHYTLIGNNYYKNLLLLNFIRYIWNSPLPDFSEYFFMELLDCKDPDPMVRLTTANKKAIEPYIKKRTVYDPLGGHSNAFFKALVKTLKEFNKHEFYSVQSFLTF